jgi:hypothetical protein
MSFWVYSPTKTFEPDDTQPITDDMRPIVVARQKLAAFVGDENILRTMEYFVPVEISHVRSQPAVLFGLSDKGKHIFQHGIVPVPLFSIYPNPPASWDKD